MKPRLLYRERDADLQGERVWNEGDLRQDLALDTVFGAMAADDEYLFDVAASVMLSAKPVDLGAIHYRQDILRDCVKNEAIIREIYDLAVGAIERERRDFWGAFKGYPPGILSRSINVLEMFADALQRLRTIADQNKPAFGSEGFTHLFDMLQHELSDAYFEEIQQHLKTLRFRNGLLISAHLGKGNKGKDYVLRRLDPVSVSFIARILGRTPQAYSFEISDRDVNGAEALSRLRGRGINLVANALAQSTDHILAFFKLLRFELALYVGSLNLKHTLEELGGTVCFPDPHPAETRRLGFRNLYDPGLALAAEARLVGNALKADEKELFIITGANQGGKSTYLRSIGLAQLMMRTGMYVCAEAFEGNIFSALLTHFSREEDAEMESGKLDEELARMSLIVDHLWPDACMLFNESFASTNPHEGSQIAVQIVEAMLEKRVEIFYVTHLYDFAATYFDRNNDRVEFLRAERLEDGTRTFRLVERKPLRTSYGPDLYEKVFGEPAA